MSQSGTILQKVEAAIVSAAIAIYNEVTDEVQTVAFTGTVTGGTFTLTYAGQVTPAQPFNVSAAALQLALQGLSTIGAGNCIVTGGPGPASFVVTFTGTLAASPQALFTFSAASLTGTSPGMTVTRTTAGVGFLNHTARQALASKVLANPSGYAALFVLGVASNSTVQTDYPPPNYTLANGVSQATADNDVQFVVNSIWNSYS